MGTHGIRLTKDVPWFGLVRSARRSGKRILCLALAALVGPVQKNHLTS
jgi:hypothetical protein